MYVGRNMHERRGITCKHPLTVSGSWYLSWEDVNEKYRFPVHIAIKLIESIFCSG